MQFDCCLVPKKSIVDIKIFYVYFEYDDYIVILI